jgi:hypothetical protein
VKRLLALLLVAVTSLSAVGCSDSTGPGSSLSGTYSLTLLGTQRVGSNPPASLYYNSASDHIEILGSQITLYNDGTYTDVTTVQDTYFAPTTVRDEQTSGTWTLSGSTLTLQDRNDFSNITYALITSNRLIIDNFAGYGVRAEYVR